MKKKKPVKNRTEIIRKALNDFPEYTDWEIAICIATVYDIDNLFALRQAVGSYRRMKGMPPRITARRQKYIEQARQILSQYPEESFVSNAHRLQVAAGKSFVYAYKMISSLAKFNKPC